MIENQAAILTCSTASNVKTGAERLGMRLILIYRLRSISCHVTKLVYRHIDDLNSCICGNRHCFHLSLHKGTRLCGGVQANGS